MPTSTPPPRRGIGGLLGLLAVLAFVVLAAVIVTRRGPEEAQAPPSTTLAAPPSTLLPPPSEAPPSSAPTSETAASPLPEEPVAASPAAGQAPRPARRPGSKPATGGTRMADSGSLPHGGPTLPPPSGTAPRRFVLGTTSIESLKPVVRDVKGFESDNVGVKRAPEVNGRVELEMDPATMRPGVDYTVKVYFANDGGKDIPVQEMKVVTVENGKTASRMLTPRSRTVKPKQRVLLSEVEGVWRESARTWAMDVVVTSARQDVYRNRLHWE
jgi:hypothetical protein